MSERVGQAALASMGVLVVLVVGVGTVAVFAEWQGVWGSYFLMERAMAAGAPAAVTVAGVSLLVSFLAVFTAR